MIIGMGANRLLVLLAMLSLFAFVRGDRTVLAASPDLANGHYQLVAVVVDGSSLSGSITTTHKVFLVDADNGKVWRYQPEFVDVNADGTPKVLSQELFVPVPIVQSK